MAGVGWGLGLISPLGILWCAIAAFIATNIESVLGATVEDKIPFYPHHTVNIINTTIGAIAAMGVALITNAL